MPSRLSLSQSVHVTLAGYLAVACSAEKFQQGSAQEPARTAATSHLEVTVDAGRLEAGADVSTSTRKAAKVACENFCALSDILDAAPCQVGDLAVAGELIRRADATDAAGSADAGARSVDEQPAADAGISCANDCVRGLPSDDECVAKQTGWLDCLTETVWVCEEADGHTIWSAQECVAQTMGYAGCVE